MTTTKSRGFTKKPEQIPRRRFRHRVVCVIATEVGEIRFEAGFRRKDLCRLCFETLIQSGNVAGASLILDGKFQGGRDGMAS